MHPIAMNLRRFRHAMGRSQEDIATALDISIATYRNYEAGRAMPRLDTLQELAQYFQTTLNDLASPSPRLHAVRLRAARKLNTRDQIILEVGKWLDEYCEIEAITDCRHTYCLANLRRQPPREMAVTARRRLGIPPKEPMRDICGLLENAGIKLYSKPVSSDLFFGMAVGEEDGGPAIAVNTWDRIPVERWIFSAAHELGHLLLHRESFHVTEEKEVDEQEQEANLFAAYFLMPEELFSQEWESTAGLPFIQRVFKAKRIMRVSYATVLYRLQEVYGSADVWREFHIAYHRAFGRSLSKKQEPNPLEACEFSRKIVEDRAADEPKRLEAEDFAADRFTFLIYTAFNNHLISEDQLTEYLKTARKDEPLSVDGWAVV